jgi:hypothetical protein
VNINPLRTYSSKRVYYILLVSLLFLYILVYGLHYRPNLIYIHGYTLTKKLISLKYPWQFKDFKTCRTPNFNIKYSSPDEESIEILADAAERALKTLGRDFKFSPARRILIVALDRKDDLSENFLWENKGAVGVYWADSIRVISPASCVFEDYWLDGPIIHELTHYIIDQLAGGNYPKWFTEGLAQYEESIITGRFWLEDRLSSFHSFYEYRRLTGNFDDLKDQELAYYQSYLMIKALVEDKGFDVINKILRDLSRGRTFERVFMSRINQSPEEYFKKINTIHQKEKGDSLEN